MYTPKVKLKPGKQPKWYNSDIRHHLNCIRTLRRKCSSHPTSFNFSKLQALEIQLQDKMSAAKSSYESSLIQNLSKGSDSRVYKYISSITKQDAIPRTVCFDSSVATSDCEKVNLFNKFFHSVFTQSSFTMPSLDKLPQPHPCLSDITITEADVYEGLASLNPMKAMGIDGIGPKLLKHCAIALYKPIHHLFVLSITKHCLPREWRLHLITPVHKSGDKSSVKNYRPISLLCIVSKVLEKIIYNKIIPFVSPSISPSQFGFRKKHSTLQQLLTFLGSVYESFGSNAQTDVIYLDFKKAFDTVAHGELLAKLWSFGVTGNLWKWFRSYLSARMQCVTLNRHISDLLPVVSGVPQGSILGPLLFLIFVNDLPESVTSSQIFLFADDTKCLLPVKGIPNCLSLQQDLDNLSLWSLNWKLNFNEAKCALVRFSSGCPHVIYGYNINGHEISVQGSQRDLGIIISSDLSWREHIKHILSKAYKMLGLIRRSFHSDHCPQAKKILYLSLVQSQLTYCSQIWRPHLLKDVMALEGIQRRATKYILRDYSSDYKYRLVTLQMLPLMMQLELHDIMFLVRCLKEPTNAFNISAYVTFSSNSTRSSTFCKMNHSLSKTNSSQHFYFNRIPRLWNSLPPIDLTQSVSCIKRTIYQFLWDHFMDNFKSDKVCTFHFLCPCSKCSCLPVILKF